MISRVGTRAEITTGAILILQKEAERGVERRLGPICLVSDVKLSMDLTPASKAKRKTVL